MNICILTSAEFPPKEGIGNYIYNMAQQFIKIGHKVTIITRGGLHRTKEDYINGIQLFRVPFVLIYPFHIYMHSFFVNRLFKTIEYKFDILNVHTPLPPLMKSKIPVVLTFHSPMLSGARVTPVTDIISLAIKFQSKYISYPLELRLINNSTIITAVSKRVARELTEYGPECRDITVIFNGVDENVFMPIPKDRSQKYILYTGRISYGKGLNELIDAAYNIHKSRNDVQFLLAGDGPLLGYLKKKVKEMDLEDTVIFLGHVGRDEIVSLYQNATIFIFPSYHEGLPGSLLEAMSCALPIIATNVPGNSELIEHNHNGILVPARDATGLSAALLQLLDDPKRQNQLGQNARTTIVERYSWNKIAKNILQCYEEAMRMEQ